VARTAGPEATTAPEPHTRHGGAHPQSSGLLIDLAAARRRCVNPDETCEIKGVGPVPVEVAMEWAGDAFIKAVLTDGTDIRTVTHCGRHRPALLDTALQVRDPKCVVPRCDNTFQEWDHHHPHADHGPTSLDNLRGPCTPHHRQLTHDNYRLEGGPGHWRWIGPDGQTLTSDNRNDLAAEARAP